MVKLEELEDEHFVDKPESTSDGALLVDDDEDYTDTDSEISDDLDALPQDESLYDRISALRDIIPPQARSRITSTASTITSATSSAVTFGGKGLWVLATSILLLGIPYALALGEEQQIMEEERQRGLMEQGAQGMISPGGQQGEAKPAL